MFTNDTATIDVKIKSYNFILNKYKLKSTFFFLCFCSKFIMEDTTVQIDVQVYLLIKKKFKLYKI